MKVRSGKLISGLLAMLMVLIIFVPTVAACPYPERRWNHSLSLTPSKTHLSEGETFSVSVQYYRTCYCPSDYFKFFYRDEATGEIAETGRWARPYWELVPWGWQTFTITLTAPSTSGTYTVKAVHCSGHGTVNYYGVDWNDIRSDGGFTGHRSEELTWDFYEIVASFTITVGRIIQKTLSPTSGGLGDIVHVTLTVTVPSGETAKVVDTLPSEWEYIIGTFTVDGVSATPTITTTSPPPPIITDISYTITAPCKHVIEFDVKVTMAYWEDRTVTNSATATWYDELGNMIEQKEATADFVIHAFEQLHKNVGKVKAIPIPPQFWRIIVDGVIRDIIVFDPPEITEGVALVRDYMVLSDEPPIPLERLTWEGTKEYPWNEIDRERDEYGNRVPHILGVGETAEYDIAFDEATTTAVLLRYTVAWASTPGVIEAHFVNEAILESGSPRVIVGQLINFDVHNDYKEPVDNLELELYGIQPSDIVGWYPGWGTPPRISPIPGGTEVIWMDSAHPVQPCQWQHFGLHLKPSVIGTGVKAYWTQSARAQLTIKEKTNVQWAFVFEVTNPFPYTMTNVVITDRFGAELEIDPPFPYSITHGTVSYTLFGKSKQVHLTWNIGNLLPGGTARLIILVSTDINPAGKQEYTKPGIYELNSGATLKFIDPKQNMQLSAVTAPIYVTVLPASDP